MKEENKDTPIEDIPKNWAFLKVGDLIDMGVIENPMDGNHGNIHPKSSDFVSNGIPFIMATDIYDGNIDFSNCKYIKKSQADKLQKGFAKEGDVLLTHKGTLGRTAIIKNLNISFIMLTPQVTYYRIKNPKKLLNIFLKYYFDSHAFQSTLKNHVSSGSTRAYIGILAQKQLPILLPPLPEQQKIAAILSTVDEKIENIDQQIEQTESLKKGLMQRLLTRGIGHTRFQSSPLGEIPESWEVKTIKNFAKVTSSKRIKQSEYVDKGVPFYRSKEIILKAKNENLEDVVHIPTNRFKELKQKYGAPKEGDILITAVGTIGVVYLVKDETFYFKDGNMLWLKDIDASINRKYLSYFLSSKTFKKIINLTVGGSSQKALTIEKFGELFVLLPEISEQQKIASILSTVDEKLENLHNKKGRYEQLKKGLMQKLLTGKIRVMVGE